jgi:ketosteroid isomerase-like protein
MNHELVEALYAALGAGDRAAVAALIHPSFEATFAAGLPYGLGGTRLGEDAIEHGWWAIGRSFVLRACCEEYVDCVDGRLIVLGRYQGHDRRTGHEVDAAFAHVWSETGGRLSRLHQITDSARWST